MGGGERRQRRGRPAASPPPRLPPLSVAPPRQSGRHLPGLRLSRHSKTSTTPPVPPPPPPPRCCCPPPPAHPLFTCLEGERHTLHLSTVSVISPGPPGGGCGPLGSPAPCPLPVTAPSLLALPAADAMFFPDVVPMLLCCPSCHGRCRPPQSPYPAHQPRLAVDLRRSLVDSLRRAGGDGTRPARLDDRPDRPNTNASTAAA